MAPDSLLHLATQATNWPKAFAIKCSKPYSRRLRNILVTLDISLCNTCTSAVGILRVYL